MNRELSFRQRLDAGWQRVELQDYYCLTDNEFDRVTTCLQDIKKGLRK